MSLKNLDSHNRWRNKTVAFRVSPEEDAQIETFVKLSGLTKQDYITRQVLRPGRGGAGNPVYKALRDHSPPSWRNCGSLRPGAAWGMNFSPPLTLSR